MSIAPSPFVIAYSSFCRRVIVSSRNLDLPPPPRHFRPRSSPPRARPGRAAHPAAAQQKPPPPTRRLLLAPSRPPRSLRPTRESCPTARQRNAETLVGNTARRAQLRGEASVGKRRWNGSCDGFVQGWRRRTHSRSRRRRSARRARRASAEAARPRGKASRTPLPPRRRKGSGRWTTRT